MFDFCKIEVDISLTVGTRPFHLHVSSPPPSTALHPHELPTHHLIRLYQKAFGREPARLREASQRSERLLGEEVLRDLPDYVNRKDA